MSSTADPPDSSALTESAVDVSTLGMRLASPSRPNLGEVRGTVGGAASGEEAWQRLFERGLISDELFRSSVRCFAVANTERTTATAHGDRLDLHEVPATVEAAVTLASDAAGVLEAERLVRILRTRLVPWGAKAVERLEWIVLTHRIAFSFRQGPALNCALYSLEYALDGIDVELRSLGPDVPWLPRFLNDIVCADAGWSIAVAESLEVPGAYGPPSELVGESFDTLENPFRTALQLWGLGYVVDYSCNFEVSTARLYTYAVDAPQNLADRLREQARERGG